MAKSTGDKLSVCGIHTQNARSPLCELNSFPMAISNSPDWSVASIYSCRKPYNNKIIIFTPSCKTLPFLTLAISKFSLFRTLSSSCPSPILENPSTNFPLTQLDLKTQDSQEYKVPDSENLNDFLCRILQDPRTENLAYEYYKKAKESQEFTPEKSMLKLLIRYSIKSKNWDFILSVLDDFRKYNVFPDSYTCSKLVSSCIKARKFRIVESLLEIFKSHSKIAVLAFDSAMKGYNKLHMYGSTIPVYEKMKLAGIFMDSGGYCQIMKAYQKIGDTERVLALFNEFESRKFENSRTSLIQIYRILCESLGKSGRAFEALEYFRDMGKKGIFGDSRIYSSLICSFASIREINVAEDLFKEAEKNKMLRDPEIFLKLILMYVEEGLIEEILEIVKAMKRVKMRMSDCIFCAIVNGFARRRGFRAAVRVYEELKSDDCEPGQVTYASIINAYCRVGLYSKAEIVFLEMQEKGFDKCVVAYSSIIAMYGKTGRLRDAMRLVAKMKVNGCEPNVWIYNSLLDMHGRVKNLRQVEKLWKEMKRRKIAPDKVTYTSVISAYNKVKEFDTCVSYYHEYRINGGAIDKAMAGIMVGVFSKIGRIDELLRLLHDMKIEGTPLDGRLYRSAFNALRDAGLQMQAKWLQESFEALQCT
ncbi:pentatricopeptide repeat-containing protein At5g13770, chloroplastic [Jatropha curcas]|uniref:pentatricopeptide repeat-containing protein At5g13770, chloroplastic n=1 Tax=Jatropha curcas TaxID=180498 RepID=UPI001893BD32|nr:pentatricopeptide repeat-containing protein At5g13770, chloroplastic [Jatropha curcas]